MISDHWEIHCDNPKRRDRYRLMSTNLLLQSQEQSFLNHPASFVAPRAMNALRQVQDLIDLDFFGINFALDAQSVLLIFEINPAMRQNFEDLDDFPYLRLSMRRIADAFSEMVRSRALASELI